MTATEALTDDLKKQVIALEDDLRQRIDEDPELREEWQRVHRQATVKERTAWSWAQWRDDRVTQTAVAWVLMSVFIRFCEDNGLVKPVWITGPGKRRQEALDAELAFFREHGTWTEREWLEDAIAYLGKLPATKALVDTHSALRYASPSGDAVENLVKFWRDRSDNGKLIHDLWDETLSTRFLGDLYQGLSQYAKDTYALLQTPVFVEEQILNWTLEPALRERPLEGFQMIDPTCGSGHFLLGSFNRLLDRWHKHAPAIEIQARVQSALDAIHGVDLNPFAVAIARFRLTVAALQTCGLRSLEEAPAFKYHLAVGDSLIHGPDSNVLPGMEERGAFMPYHYATEDAQLLLEFLQERRYDAVVGNPPYITVKDKALNKIYRAKFGKICKGTYALTVPFMVQFFALAKRGEHSGWVGMITSNSFMKREFGVPLIETFMPTVDLRLVVDSEGAWIPGHNTDGTPTVIIVGKSQSPVQPVVRAILSKGVRETREHGDEGNGPYWSAVVSHWNDPGWDDNWISVTDLERRLLATHPWSLSGGGAIQLIEAIEQGKARLSARIVSPVGRSIRAGADEAFVRPVDWALRNPRLANRLRVLLAGEDVRDWVASPELQILYPYVYGTKERLDDGLSLELWPLRTVLANRGTFSGDMAAAGLEWWEYMQHTSSAYTTPRSIAFAEVATHNHFVLDCGGRVFKQTAPIIKLPATATEDAHFELLGVLNSSTACFWLKQNSQPKGGAADVSWLRTYQMSATTIQDLPLPGSLPIESARGLVSLAQDLSTREPQAICANGVPSREMLASAKKESEEIRARMVALQEELDWEVYRLYGLIDEDLNCGMDDLPELALGERAFEIALASSREETTWFTQHGSAPVAEIPARWPTTYRELVQRRLRLIAEHQYIRLLEKPEYKRRWSQDSWDKRQEQAVRGWLLDRLENRRFWFDGVGSSEPKNVVQIADEVSRDTDMVSVLSLWEGRPDVPVNESLAKLLADEAVPFLAAYRCSESGLRTRQAWEEMWGLQRRADRGAAAGTIPVPPKYRPADFRRPSYWRARGKLDVPKERFILYPDANRQGDPTTLLGWAGWDHAEQSLALSRIIGEREQEGWDDERLVPLVAGLAELQPWVEQWHSDVDERYGVSLAAFCREQLDQRAAQVGKTPAELAAWRPAPSGRGRKAGAKGGAK